MRSNVNKQPIHLERERRIRSRTPMHSSDVTRVRQAQRPVPPRASAFPSALVVRTRSIRRYEALFDEDITSFPTPIIGSAAPRFASANQDTDTLPTHVLQPEEREDDIDTMVTIALTPVFLAAQKSVSILQHQLFPAPASSLTLTPPSTYTVPGQMDETDELLYLSTYSGSSRDGLLARYWDRLCWWLIVPGRIEFLFWIGGLLLLLSLTIVITLAIVLSLRLFCP